MSHIGNILNFSGKHLYFYMHLSGTYECQCISPRDEMLAGVTECWGREMGRWAVFCDSSRGPVYRWIDNIPPDTVQCLHSYRYHQSQSEVFGRSLSSSLQN